LNYSYLSHPGQNNSFFLPVCSSPALFEGRLVDQLAGGAPGSDFVFQAQPPGDQAGERAQHDERLGSLLCQPGQPAAQVGLPIDREVGRAVVPDVLHQVFHGFLAALVFLGITCRIGLAVSAAFFFAGSWDEWDAIAVSSCCIGLKRLDGEIRVLLFRVYITEKGGDLIRQIS